MPISIRVGLGDEVGTQLLAGPLSRGQQVIVGVANTRSEASFLGIRLGF